VSYVDAGYAVALSVLFAYAMGLILRRRALERRADLSKESEPIGEAVEGARGPERAEP
jgi:hypothetical protein